MTASACWQVTVAAPARHAAAVADALTPHVDAVSVLGSPDDATHQVTGYAGQPPDAAAITTAVAAVAPDLAPVVTDLGARDWLAENRASFAPIAVGRFFVHPTHLAGAPPAGAIALAIDAAAAFGTGAHGSTQGCLAALDGLAKAGSVARFGPVLDVGCGTAVLALAAAALTRRRVVAGDIDPVAVVVARANARRNCLAPWLTVVRAAGLQHPAIAAGAPYGLIFANILARPLAALARPIVRNLAPGGHVVLSGLLASQEAQVRHRYAALALRRRIDVGEWRTLVLQAPNP